MIFSLLFRGRRPFSLTFHGSEKNLANFPWLTGPDGNPASFFFFFFSFYELFSISVSTEQNLKFPSCTYIVLIYMNINLSIHSQCSRFIPLENTRKPYNGQKWVNNVFIKSWDQLMRHWNVFPEFDHYSLLLESLIPTVRASVLNLNETFFFMFSVQ